MKKQLALAALVFTLLTGFLVWWFSDNQIVKRQTAELAELFTMESDTSKAGRAAKTQSLSELMSNQFFCSIDLENYKGTHTKDELIEMHLYLAKACERSHVRMGKINIISITDTRAEIEADFNIDVHLKRGDNHSESTPASLIWKKSDQGAWELIKASLASPK